MCHANHNRLPPLAFFCFNDDQNSECPAMASADKTVDYTALQAAPGGTAWPGAGTEQRALTGAEYAEQRELREAQQHILSGRALVVDLLTESTCTYTYIHSVTQSRYDTRSRRHLNVQQILIHHFEGDLLLPHGVRPAVLHNTPPPSPSPSPPLSGTGRQAHLISRRALHHLDGLQDMHSTLSLHRTV